MMKYYDNIIIGGGIAGLYMAYNINKRSRESYLILERNDKKMIGGRVCVRKFHGIDVLGGAGIGRLKKDFLLMKLLDELRLSYNRFNIETQFANNIKNHIDVMKTFRFLKKSFDNNNHSNLTFKEFALTVLNNKEYKDFRIATSLSDYENEDVIQTLKYYGMDDNSNELVAISVPWKDLIDKLIEKINIKNIRCNQTVNKIIKQSNYYEILTDNETYSCNKVYIATDIDTIRKLLNKEHIYREIKGQPFLRIYGKFSGESIKIMDEYVKKTTIVSTSLYKIIKIKPDIYMICYSDNKGAKDTLKIINADKDNIKLTKLLKKSLDIDEDIKLKIDDIMVFYWKNGTHYYKPLDRIIFRSRNDFIRKAQHPDKNMYVIGEVVSMNQGWTEGALESVDRIL